MTKRKQQPPETQLAFVIQTPTSNSTKNNAKLIRSHAARLPSSRKHEKQVKSWILKKEDKSTALRIPDGSIPGRVGTNLSLLDFPEPLKPYMENDMFRWFHGMKGTLYPQEICLQINALHSSWTTNLLIDKIYFHAVLFSIETYFNPQGTLSHFHFAKTLRLLQDRLNSPDETAISDATIMVVVMLGLSAELIGDSGAAEKHVDGLKRIVVLRGGLEGLRFDNPRLPAKVCRVDLGLVLRFGCKPVFFNEDISWNPYLPPQARMKKTTQHPEAFIKTLGPRLANVWKDLHEFSTLSNLAYQTDRKLQPNTFSEIMISILYRLVALNPESPVENVIRLGMMTFTASIFFRWRDMKQRQAYLDGSFRDALTVLRKASVQPPRAVVLWLLVLWEMNINGDGFDVFLEWTCEILRDMEIRSWDGIREVLKTVIWIDCLFDTPGRRAFEPILAHVNGQPRDIEL